MKTESNEAERLIFGDDSTDANESERFSFGVGDDSRLDVACSIRTFRV